MDSIILHEMWNDYLFWNVICVITVIFYNQFSVKWEWTAIFFISLQETSILITILVPRALSYFAFHRVALFVIDFVMAESSGLVLASLQYSFLFVNASNIEQCLFCVAYNRNNNVLVLESKMHLANVYMRWKDEQSKLFAETSVETKQMKKKREWLHSCLCVSTIACLLSFNYLFVYFLLSSFAILTLIIRFTSISK